LYIGPIATVSIVNSYDHDAPKATAVQSEQSTLNKKMNRCIPPAPNKADDNSDADRILAPSYQFSSTEQSLSKLLSNVKFVNSS